MKNVEDIEIRDVICRIMPKLDKAIDKIIKPNNKKLFNKKLYLNGQNNQGYEPPIYTSAYYKYKHIAKNENHNVDIYSMDLNNFFKICKFTNVSADYYLGFRESTRTEPSAPTVKEDFGLSDKAMETLSAIHNKEAERKGQLTSSVINSILENRDFWNKMDEFLPVYVECLNYSRFNDFDIEIARHDLVKAFKELLDEIAKPMINEDFKKLDFGHDNLQHKLDLTGIYPKAN